MKNYISILALLLLIGISLIPKSTSAQNSDLNFDYLSIEDGLSQTAVNCIIQDREGYMWFGTQSGLNKYNGSASYPFEIFQHDLHDTNSLSNNWIFDIAEDKIGNLWVGTLDGLNKLNKNTGNVTRYLHDPYNPSSLNNEEVLGVYIDSKGYVWAKTSDALNKLDTLTGKFTHYIHHRDYFNTSKSNIHSPIFEDKAGNLWVATLDGLNLFDRSHEKFILYNVKNSNISDNYITDIYEDLKGNLWIGTQNGLNKFNYKKRNFKHYFSEENNANSLSQNHITSIHEDHIGNIWIGTFGGGLNKFNSRTNQFTNYRHNKNNARGISHDVIFTIYQDRSNILWVGTYGAGLNKIDLKKKKFQLYSEQSIGLSSNVIAGIHMDNNSNLWIGTWGNGLNIYNRKTGDIEYYSSELPEPKRIVNDYVHVIFQDSKGKIWLGTRQGINIINPKTRKISTLTDYFKNSSINNRVSSIIEDRKGQIWIGTERALYRLNQKTTEITSFQHNTNDPYSISANFIYSIVEDKDGFIWIGTVNGLNKYDPNTGIFHQYKSDVNAVNSISNNTANCVLEDSEGNIWIATSSGLNKYDKKEDKFSIYTTKNGLPSDLVYSILEDNSNRMWFGTGRGLARLDKKSEEIRTYDKDEGLGSLEFNLGASYKGKKGELFFGGTEGLNSFIPDSIKNNPFVPNIVFTYFEKSSNKGRKRLFVENGSEVILSYQDHSFIIEFAALEFTNPKKSNYKYIMEGLDDEWNNIGNRNFATFSNIPAGEYTFRVTGSNNDLVWNEEDAYLTIIVEPHFLKTKWAYLIYILIIGILLYLFIEFRTKSLKEANSILREKQLASLEIAKQKEELTIKNKSITDSINYAKRIQEAMMPSKYLFRRLIPEFFILYKPKDIVSGDFYWVTEKNNKIFIAAVDCTGHGVPGAFMSIIGFDLLRNITNDQGIEDPAQILNLLNKGVTETFSKNVEDHTVRDGMDLGLCVIDKNKKIIEYSGAVNPMYLIRDDKIIEVKGNRFSVGMLGHNEEKLFESHSIPYQEDDMIYLFSDGYPDQFGGPLGKKFKYRRFRHSLLSIHKLPAQKQQEYLEDTIENWRGELEQIDDILIIGFKITGI